MSAYHASTARPRGILATLAVCALLALLLFAWSRTGPDPAAANPLTGMAAVTAGGSHTCALTTAGGVKCWGLSSIGQSGEGTTTDRTVPVDVMGMTSGVAAVTAGNSHTCVLTTGGGAKCWGGNSEGQLGDGAGGSFGDVSLTPVDVSGLTSGVAAVAAGESHACALTTAGGVKCWGRNAFGRLGDGTTIARTVPVDVVGLTSGVAAITAGNLHTCALTTAGGVKCWGRNFQGQLGDGTTTNSTTPVDVSGLSSGVAAVTAGSTYTCAVTTVGGVKCWGGNSWGRLGDGTTTNSTTPVDVVGLTSSVGAVAAGNYHTCALTTAGGAKCWGSNSEGQLGDGTGGTFGDSSLTPIEGSGLTSGVAAVAAGQSHSCAVTTTGGLKCWGRNNFGQLGDGTSNGRLTPMDVVVEVVKPTPTPTPCPAEGCPSPTPTPPGPAMSLAAPGTVFMGVTFLVAVKADPAPDEFVIFGSEVLFPAGLQWLPRPLCEDEVQVGRPDGGSLWLCQSSVTTPLGGAGHAAFASLGLPPYYPPFDVVAGSTTALVELDFVCDMPGSYQLTLTANPDSPHGAVFADTNGTKIQVKTVEHDYDGDTVPNQVADTIDIDCGVLGDTTCDGAVSIADAQLIAQLVVGRISGLGCPDHADVDGSGGVGITDAQLIAQLIVGRIDNFPGV